MSDNGGIKLSVNKEFLKFNINILSLALIKIFFNLPKLIPSSLVLVQR